MVTYYIIYFNGDVNPGIIRIFHLEQLQSESLHSQVNAFTSPEPQLFTILDIPAISPVKLNKL